MPTAPQPRSTSGSGVGGDVDASLLVAASLQIAAASFSQLTTDRAAVIEATAAGASHSATNAWWHTGSDLDASLVAVSSVSAASLPGE